MLWAQSAILYSAPFLLLCARQVIREAMHYDRNTIVSCERLKDFASEPQGTNKIGKIVEGKKAIVDTMTKML